MKCPYCGCENDNVVDSRKADDGKSVRRRRECVGCGKRYTTYERVEVTPIVVIKKNGVRTIFDRSKVESGIIRACNKRPISIDEIHKLVDSIEEELYSSGNSEITTDTIGELILKKLMEVDAVAYIRFASVYRNFNDASEFISELNKIKNGKENK